MFFYEIEGYKSHAKIELIWTSKKIWPKKSFRLDMQAPFNCHIFLSSKKIIIKLDFTDNSFIFPVCLVPRTPCSVLMMQ